MNFPWNKACREHREYMLNRHHGHLCHYVLHHLKYNRTLAKYGKAALPWRWSVQWSGSIWGGRGWCRRRGLSGGSSCLCQRIQTGSTWGSTPREITGRTIPCTQHTTHNTLYLTGSHWTQAKPNYRVLRLINRINHKLHLAVKYPQKII